MKNTILRRVIISFQYSLFIYLCLYFDLISYNLINKPQVIFIYQLLCLFWPLESTL